MKPNQLKAGVILSYASMLIGNVITIIYTPVMLRLLGQSEYGLYNLASSVVGYLGLLTFGFDSAYVRCFSRCRANGDRRGMGRLNGMFMLVFSVLGLFALAGGAVLAVNIKSIFASGLSPWELSRARLLTLILSVNLALSFPFLVFKVNVTANERYIFQRILNLIKTVTSPFITFPLLILGFGSVAMVISTTALSVAIEISNAVYCFKKLKIEFDFSGFDTKLLKEITVFSSFIFINIIVDQINWSIDKVLLGIYKGTTAVAVYGLAAQLNTYYMTFSTAVSSVFVPKICRMTAAKSPDYSALSRLVARVGRIQFFVLSMLLGGLIFFGKPFICLWAGENYAGSYAVALMLIVPVTLPLVQTLAMEMQRAMNMHRFRAFLYLAIAAFNAAVSLALCKKYGALGCAFGTALALLIGNGLVMNIYYGKKMRLDILYFWREILKIFPSLVLPYADAFLMSRCFNLYNPAQFIGAAAVYAAVFCISVYLVGFNSGEKELIKAPVAGFLKMKMKFL